MDKYINDKLWNDIKMVSREQGFKDDWLKIISYYNLYKGGHVKLYITDRDTRKRYRVIAVDDSDKVAICIDSKGETFYLDKQAATIMRKYFKYDTERTNLIKISLDGFTCNHDDFCEYYK